MKLTSESVNWVEGEGVRETQSRSENIRTEHWKEKRAEKWSDDGETEAVKPINDRSVGDDDQIDGWKEHLQFHFNRFVTSKVPQVAHLITTFPILITR